MLQNDEIVALNALMFVERWRLQPWLDIRWNDEDERFSTFIMHSPGGFDDEETECEIASLDDLNVLLATDAEFYRNVTTLISIGALETHDVDVESLIRIIVERVSGIKSKITYPYSMVTGAFSPLEDLIYRFNEREEETGKLALKAIKTLARTGDWWGETLEIRHISKHWSNETREFVPSEDKFFTVAVAAHDAYRMACHETVRLTEENFPVFEEAVADVVFNAGKGSLVPDGASRNHWASILFCERSEEINDQLASYALPRMPEGIAALFEPEGQHKVL